MGKKASIASPTQSSMEVRATMDLFQHRYYRLNKIFMKSTGQWPYQSARVRSVILAAILTFAATETIPQTMAFLNNLDDSDILMECAPSLIFCAFVITKLISSAFNSHKITAEELFRYVQMLMLLNHIRADWEVMAHDRDFDVLHEYAQTGRKFTIVYAVAAYSTCVLFVIQPVVPKIIDVLLKNGTEPGQFPILVDYCFIDVQKYYFYIILHSYLYTSLGYISTIAYDCMFMVFVLHGCGLFAALGRKLERIGKNERSEETEEIAYALKESHMDFEHLVSCIAIHNHAIEYAELLEDTYAWCFLFIVGFNMLLISLEGIQVVTKTIAPEETVRYIACSVLSMVHLYVESYMAQSLMDHSISIRYYIIHGKWYRLPLKAQKLLPMMIMRCNVPCQITAGKMSVMSVETFGVVLKTSMSYFTLLRSA